MQSYSHRIPSNIMEKLSKIRDKIADELKNKQRTQVLLQELENAYQAITGMTKEQIKHEAPNIPFPNEEEKKEGETTGKYLVDSYRQLVEDNQNLRNAIAFFIMKLRAREEKLTMVQIKSDDECTSNLINTLFNEINDIIQETENKK